MSKDDIYIYFTTKAWKMNLNVKITEDFSSISWRENAGDVLSSQDWRTCWYASDLLPPLFIVLAGGHHHLAKLVEVHRPAPILVNLGDDPVEVLLGQVGVDLRHDGSELGHGDEALPTWEMLLLILSISLINQGRQEKKNISPEKNLIINCLRPVRLDGAQPGRNIFLSILTRDKIPVNIFSCIWWHTEDPDTLSRAN